MSEPKDRLESWKEIAAFLGRGVSTVQRWEREEGLPTHRLHHNKLGSVYAFKSELEAWRKARREAPDSAADDDSPTPSPAPPVDTPLPPPPTPRTARGLGARALWLGAIVAVGLVALAVNTPVSSPTPSPSPAPPRTYPITSARGMEQDPALSPDGSRVAYVADGGGDTFDLYVRAVESPSELRLTTSEASECCPAWSADQQTVAFLRLRGSEAVLITMPSLGGAEQRRVDLVPWYGSALSFSPDGRHIVYSDRDSPDGPFVVKRLTLETDEIRRLTTPSAEFSGDAFPKYSPDGRQVALARLGFAGDVTDADVYVVPAEGGEPRRLTRDRRFLPELDWDTDGRSVIFFSNRTETARLWRVPVAGGEPTLLWPGGDPFAREGFAEALMDVSHAFRFSTARRTGRIALTRRHYDTNIYRFDPAAPLERADQPFIGSSQTDESPQVSPDGKRVAFSSSRSGQQELWLCAGDGSACSVLAKTPHGGTPRWSPDARTLVFDAWSESSVHADVFTLDVDSLAIRRVTSGDADEVVPSWSRDGRSIYFSSNRTGAWQVFRAPAAGGDAVQVTREGGFAAFESPDGKDVLYTRFNAPGLFRVASEGGPERQILDQPRCWGHWTVAREGVYWLEAVEGGDTHLDFLPFAGGNPRRVATLHQRPPCGESSLAVFPDGRTLLYVGVEETSDIAGVDLR